MAPILNLLLLYAKLFKFELIFDTIFYFINKGFWETKVASSGSEGLIRVYSTQDGTLYEVEMFKGLGWGNWDVEGLLRDADVLEGLAFVQVAVLMAWKRMMGRPKDLKDIAMLEGMV